MTCFKCGSETGTAKFCPECGTAVEFIDPNPVEAVPVKVQSVAPKRQGARNKKRNIIVAITASTIGLLILALLIGSQNIKNPEPTIPYTTAKQGAGYINGDYVEVVGAVRTKNWYGEDECVVLRIRWTNNGRDAAPFFRGKVIQVFQEDILLKYTWGKGIKDEKNTSIHVGKTYEFDTCYLLIDDKSSVDVEISDTIRRGSAIKISFPYESLDWIEPKEG